MSIPITPQDIIVERDSIGLTPDKFSAWVDYVERLERELEFSSFDAERQRFFSRALAKFLLEISRAHTDYLIEYRTDETRLLDNWKFYLIESLEMLDQQVTRGEIELEQVEELKEKLGPVLSRLGIPRYGGSAAESGAA